ncbi:Alkyl hydroperoxide reductase subunit C-like protein [Cyclobacterium qasimii]|uniref:Alkyl hydroperoxide reductase subunit C-like protein n=1 Tax=Cyclobacterium qasimii M12-11B TaxID=641524 RepID=S7VLJ1_9BACT|nr:Alkyl hydroperoxide reductase subunit C-like protein [Cyclobacterium qasimii]EPR71075.1 Alkyl hydroperoxide reductase subunit C-like protein [Cyclobacterium qasimii M12-11B]
MENISEMKDQVVTMPRIGDKAPDFEAVTTKGKLNFQNLLKINGW